jgi:transposase
MADFFWFSDEQWARIEPLLPTGLRGARRVDDRRVLSGIVRALQSGGRWGDCSPVYGSKKTLYNRFVRWAERGVWQDIFSALTGAEGIPDRLFIDSTCIKAHRRRRKRGALANGIGQTREGRNSKVHAVCDVKVAKACIAAMPPSTELVGDKGYDSNDLRAWLATRGTIAVIPSKKNRKVQLGCDMQIYKQRNVVERMFCRFKDWRRVATRFDRNIKNSIATIAIAATVIWWLK